MTLWLRSALFNGLFYLLMGVTGLLFAPLALVSRRSSVWVIKRFTAASLMLLRLVCGLRVLPRGPVPQGKALLCAKHQSFLDVLVLFHLLPAPLFVMKRELRLMPVFGFYAMRAGMYAVNRAGGAAALRTMLRAMGMRWRGEQLVVFPQGTRVAPFAHAPYRRGIWALHAACRDVACVPVATNAGLFWARNSFLRRPGVAIISFLPPLPAEADRAHFMQEMERRIERESDALARESLQPPLQRKTA